MRLHDNMICRTKIGLKNLRAGVCRYASNSVSEGDFRRLHTELLTETVFFFSHHGAVLGDVSSFEANASVDVHLENGGVGRSSRLHPQASPFKNGF